MSFYSEKFVIPLELGLHLISTDSRQLKLAKVLLTVCQNFTKESEILMSKRIREGGYEYALANGLIINAGGINLRFTELETRMGSLETNMESLDTRMGSLETNMESLDTRMGSLESAMNAMGDTLKSINDKLNTPPSESSASKKQRK